MAIQNYTPAPTGKAEIDNNNEQLQQIMIQVQVEIESLKNRIKDLEAKGG